MKYLHRCACEAGKYIDLVSLTVAAGGVPPFLEPEAATEVHESEQHRCDGGKLSFFRVCLSVRECCLWPDSVVWDSPMFSSLCISCDIVCLHARMWWISCDSACFV